MIVALALASVLSLPVRVDGDGYLRFVREGRVVYATSATLTTSGGLLGSKGLPLTPSVRVPSDATRLEVDLSGDIVAVNPGGRVDCGRIVLARFDAKPVEDRGFLVFSSKAGIGNPGEGTFGIIRSTNSTSGPAAVTGSASVAVRQISEVEGDTVLLKDIATIQAEPKTKQTLESISICGAPPAGVDIPMTESRIKALIKRAGLDAEVTIQPKSIVRRKAQVINQEDFVAVAIKAAQASLGINLALTCVDPPQGDFIAPVGNVELTPESVSPNGTNLTVRVAVYVDKKPVNARNVVLKPDASARVAAGAVVKILMKSAGVTVEVSGRTRTGGMVGQSVTVMTDTGSVLSGIVIGAGKVEVKL